MTTTQVINEWSGSCDPCDPDSYWIDDVTGERVDAATGARSEHDCPLLDVDGCMIEHEKLAEEQR